MLTASLEVKLSRAARCSGEGATRPGEAGTYTVLVNDGLGRETGTYTLSFSTDGESPVIPTMPPGLLILLAGLLAATGRGLILSRVRRPRPTLFDISEG